jgi:hypothetical protein
MDCIETHIELWKNTISSSTHFWLPAHSLDDEEILITLFKLKLVYCGPFHFYPIPQNALKQCACIKHP